MWLCPKCGREFAHANQHHFCGKIDSIDAYIDDQPEEVRPVLSQTREIIRAAGHRENLVANAHLLAGRKPYPLCSV